MASMIKFDSLNEIHSFIDRLDIYNGWKISKGLLNERGSLIKDKQYYEFLKNLFNEKNLFRRSVSIAEVVSWLDSLVIMKRLSHKLASILTLDEMMLIKIDMEYKIEYSKMMRIDYIIHYKKSLMLVEFRLVDSFNKVKPTWEKKKIELIVYKELMENYLSIKKIYTYAMITLFEYEKGRQIEKHITFNNNQVEYFSKYIRDILIRRNFEEIL